MMRAKNLLKTNKLPIVDLIAKKREGEEFSNEDIRVLVDAMMHQQILPEQLAAMIMAIYFRGLSAQETSILTDEVILSGEVMDLTRISAAKVGFRGIGGLGDKCALVLTPLVASCGVIVPMMVEENEQWVSNDLLKLCSIPGFKAVLPMKDCLQQLKKVGCCFCWQPKQVVPVDQVLSKIRETTATQASVPLTASSILSRLLSTGAENVVMNIQYAGWMFNEESGKQLASLMTRVMHSLKHRCVVLVTNIQQPLGDSVGTFLEIKEVLELLQGKGDEYLRELIIKLAMEMVRLSGVCGSTLSAKKMVTEHLANGSALEKFKAMVKAQGGNIAYLEHPEKFPKSKYVRKIQVSKRGYVHSVNIDLLKKGIEALLQPDASGKVDPTAGLTHTMKAGMQIIPGDALMEVHYNDPSRFEAAEEYFRSAYCLAPKRPACSDLSIERFA